MASSWVKNTIQDAYIRIYKIRYLHRVPELKPYILLCWNVITDFFINTTVECSVEF